MVFGLKIISLIKRIPEGVLLKVDPLVKLPLIKTIIFRLVRIYD